MSPVLPSNWSFQIEEKYKEPYTFSVYFLHLTVADLRPLPPEPKFFQFHAVFGKIWQNLMLAPPLPGELAPPPRGNPGSATASNYLTLLFLF